MNSKFFVPFETAKALKEKGYPQCSDWVYYSDGNTYHRLNCVDDSNSTYAAPTYHEVLDWLEGRGKRVLVDYFTYEDGGVWLSLIAGSYGNYATKAGEFKTREEALNAAILKALELI